MPATIAYPNIQHHIAGQWLGGEGGRTLHNPADGSMLGVAPQVSAAQVSEACASAYKGFLAWRRVLPVERCTRLKKAADLMRARAEAMALVLTLEEGKPLTEALREVRLSADIIEFQAEEAKRLYGHSVPVRVPGILSHAVEHQPVGVVAALTAWNFPINLPARKLGAALAAGCSVVLKPAETTPASAQMLVQCLLEGGVEPLAVQVVHGDPAMVSATLLADPHVRKLSFTGSVEVGQQLGAAAALAGKGFSGELGGHAPVIICEDADIDSALKASLPAKFRNAGQVCSSPIRFYVARKHYPRWADGFVAGARALTLGSGLGSTTAMGPLAHAGRVADMESLMADARSCGAAVLTGGERVDRPGYFFAPTVLADVPPHAAVRTREPFGPIALLYPFDDLDDAIAQANDSPYGLAAYAFTRDVAVAHNLGQALEAGMVGLNHYGVSQPELPFGGTKASGNAHEMGKEGLLAYTELKTITLGDPRP
jgi:succinate-semialdehyde dehydrogenase / glutarate-semialdehyde dehydrogenase